MKPQSTIVAKPSENQKTDSATSETTVQEMVKESAFRRRMRLLGSALIIGFPAAGMLNVAVSASFKFTFLFGLYGVYVLVVAWLVCAIAGRLYKLHGARELKVDVGILLLLTTLLAVPFGFSNLFLFVLQNVLEIGLKKNVDLIQIYMVIGMYLLIPPIFYVAEFTLSVWRPSNDSNAARHRQDIGPY